MLSAATAHLMMYAAGPAAREPALLQAAHYGVLHGWTQRALGEGSGRGELYAQVDPDPYSCVNSLR